MSGNTRLYNQPFKEIAVCLSPTLVDIGVANWDAMTYDLSAIYGSSKTDIVNTLLLAPTVRASRSVLTLWSDAECRFCRRQNDVVVWKTLYILQADKSPPCSLGEIRPRE